MTTLLETLPESAPMLQSRSAGRWLQVLSHIDPRYGGLSAAVPALAASLTRSGFHISVAAFTAPDEHAQPGELAAGQLSCWPLGRRPWLNAHLRASFRSTLSLADAVHIHGLWEQSTAQAAATARSLQIPYILSAHGMLEPWALNNKRLKKQIYTALVERRNVGRAACLHALTEAEARHYIRFGARSPIAVIPNAIEVPSVATPDPFLDRFPVVRGRRIILFLARLHPKKGLDLLVDAWSRVASHYPEAHLVIAGADFENTRAGIEAQVSSLQLSDSVLFTGMLDHCLKWSALAAAEAFVLPSLSEGLSVGALEAMGMGVPVLITEPCNMPAVREFRTGWQIQPNVPELTAALQQILANSPQRNAHIGGRAAELVRTRFSWPVVSRQFTELYHWVQGGPQPASVSLIYP